MRLYSFQHVPFEDPAYITEWAQNKGISLQKIALYENEPLPSPDDCDALIIMGGPMGANDEHIHPWLKNEKQFIEEAIKTYRIIIGICHG